MGKAKIGLGAFELPSPPPWNEKDTCRKDKKQVLEKSSTERYVQKENLKHDKLQCG